MNTAIQLAQSQPVAHAGSAPLNLSSEQESLIRDMYGNGATETEFQVFLEVCRARRLNPLTRQIYFVQRWDSEKQRQVWAAQVSIDGFRAIAERTGKYDGQDEPEYEYDAKGVLVLARVKVYRKDWSRPAVGVARFGEYCARKKDGSLTHMWATKGHVMIAKCAEALGLRKAFPEELSGVYAPEEMDADSARSPKAQAPKGGNSVAHHIMGEDDPYRDEEASPYARLHAQLTTIEEMIAKCTKYEEALTIRVELGGKGHKQSRLGAEIQEAGPGKKLISGAEFKELSKIFARCDRQLAKKEKELAPDILASFVDPEPGDAHEGP